MSITDQGDRGSPSPSEAFVAVGDETRIQILRALGEDGPLSFSGLYDRVDIDDTGNFTYHLDRLVGHFVRKGDGEYALREPGGCIVQTILTGHVTEHRVLESTRLDAPCPYCEAAVEVGVRDGRVLVRCTDCAGTYAGGDTPAEFPDDDPHGTIACYRLPPAGLDDRAPRDVLETALARALTERHALSREICPRCAATVDRTLRICGDHDADADICGRCSRRRALHVDYHCTNCIRRETDVPAGLHLVGVPELVAFAARHGIEPVLPSWSDASPLLGYEEELCARDPLRARFRYAVGGDALTLTVDDALAVVDAG